LRVSIRHNRHDRRAHFSPTRLKRCNVFSWQILLQKSAMTMAWRRRGRG